MLALTASGGPALAAAPLAFDLVCTGNTSGADGLAAPFSMRLSIDRRGKRWCYRDVGCPRILPVLADHAGAMILLAVKTPLNEANLTVNLGDGAFARDSMIPDRPTSARHEAGACAVAAYTPIR